MNISLSVSISLNGTMNICVEKLAKTPSTIEIGSAGSGLSVIIRMNIVTASPTKILTKQMMAVKKSPELNDLPTRML